jgi:uncharacterized protein
MRVSTAAVVRLPPSTSRRVRARAELNESDRTRRTNRWIDDIIIGWSLCPFAKPLRRTTQSLTVLVTNARALEKTCESEASRLMRAPTSSPHTTLLVLEEDVSWEEFMDGPAAACARACERATGDEVTVVPFHPEATFDGENACGNFTSRSPHATVHLLRKVDIERAENAWYVDEEREDIRLRNVEYLNALGVDELRRAFGEIARG